MSTTEPCDPDTTTDIKQVEAVPLVPSFFSPTLWSRQKDSLNRRQAGLWEG